MFISEIVFHWVAVGFYILSSVLFTYGYFFDNFKATRRALIVGAIGVLPHCVALLKRWIDQGHGPYMSRYEVLSSDALIAIVLFLIFAYRIEKIRSIGLVVMPVSFLLIAFGLMTNPALHNLPPSLRSVWLVMHVSFAKLAAGGILMSFGTAVVYLLKDKNPEQKLLGRMPSIEILDEYCYKFAGFGFIFWTVNIIAGSIWANESWGRYWGWDPIETWSIITWLLYGIFAHLRVFWRLRGRKSAMISIAIFGMSIFTIFILPFIADSLHTEYFIK